MIDITNSIKHVLGFTAGMQTPKSCSENFNTLLRQLSDRFLKNDITFTNVFSFIFRNG